MPATRLIFAMLLLITASPHIAAQRQSDVLPEHQSPSITAPDGSLLRGVGLGILRWRAAHAVLAAEPDLALQRALTSSQVLAYGELKRACPDLRVFFDEYGVPIFMSASRLQPSKGHPEATAMQFLQQHASLLRLSSPLTELRLEERVTGRDMREHLRYRQIRNGIPVRDAEVYLHFSPTGDLELVTARYAGDAPVRGSVRLTSGQAITAVTGMAKRWTSSPVPAATHGTLEYIQDGGDLLPVYSVQFTGEFGSPATACVHAGSGAVLASTSALRNLSGSVEASADDALGNSRDFYVWHKDDTVPEIYWMVDASTPMFDPTLPDAFDGVRGTIVTTDAIHTPLTAFSRIVSPDNSWSNAIAVSAHANARQVYDYFHDTHGRISLDDQGGGMLSVINVSADGGGTLDRAFWNGRMVAYGTGDAGMRNLAAGLDIGAHEWVHALIESTARLAASGQPGALGEAICDVFACMIDREDWQIGEDVVIGTDVYPSGFMRDLSSPHNQSSPGEAGWQPDRMSEYVGDPGDPYNPNAHVNAGIPAHAMYLIAQDITREKTEDILYDALQSKLVRNAHFIDFRLAVIRSAEELYGAGSAEAAACAAAFDAVGISDGQPTSPPDRVAPVDGTDRILFVNTDEFLPATLWIAVPPAQGDQDFTSLSFTPVTGRPSVTDDGSTAFFIDDEYNLRVIALTGDPNEQVVDGSGIWNSVAVSRDGNRVALTTVNGSGTIFLLDISGPVPVSRSFDVEVPSYNGSGLPPLSTVIETMEFSHDDEQLLLGLRSTYNINGRNRTFNDIAVMDVWNSSAQDYRDGATQRVLPSFPPSESSHPVWAQTRSSMLAFDHVDEVGNAYVVIADIHTGAVSYIPVSSTPALPTFSGTDSLVSYMHMDGEIPIVMNQPLMPDGMTPTGNPVGFIFFATQPRWLRIGQRPVAVEDLQSANTFALLQNYPNPFNPSTTLRFSLDRAANVQLRVIDNLGRSVRLLAAQNYEAGLHSVQWDSRDDLGRMLPSGTYHAVLICGDRTVTRTMLLLK